MKKVLIVVMITLLTSPILAQQGSIAFVNKTATELVTASGSSGKLIFIDMTATWCAPCKEMEKTSFVDKTVTDYYTSHFFSKKIYIDRDSVATDPLELLLKSLIQGVPHFFFLDHKGNILLQESGFLSAEKLLELGAKARNTTSPQYEVQSMELVYSKNLNNKRFLLKYMQLENAMGQKAHKALYDYLKLIPEADYSKDSVVYTIIDNEQSIYGAGYQIISSQAYQQAAMRTQGMGRTSIGYDMYHAAISLIERSAFLAVNTKNRKLLDDSLSELNRVMQNKDDARERGKMMEAAFQK